MIYSNRIRNEEIYLTIWVTFIDEKINKSYLRQFGYVQRTVVNAPVKMSKLIQVQKTKQIKKYKKKIVKVIKLDFRQNRREETNTCGQS